MQRLNSDDSTEKYLRTIEYHLQICRRRKAEEIFVQLMLEGTPLRDKLEAKVTAMTAQSRVIDELSADFDAQELLAEDIIRDLDSDLQKLDRQEPALNAQKKVFPGGFGVVISVEGESQIETLISTRQALRSFESKSLLADSLKRLDHITQEMTSTSKAREDQRKKLQSLAQDERDLKVEIAEHLISVHGRLRSYFKAKPALADRFFLRVTRSGASPLVKAEAKGKSGALLSFLSGRGLTPSEEQQKKLKESTDLSALDRWISRAINATSVEELFAGDPIPTKPAGAKAKKS
jgi:hypothetical protein